MRDHTDLAQDEYDKKFDQSDEEAKLSEEAQSFKIAHASFQMIGLATQGDPEKREEMRDIIVNDDDILNAVIALIDNVAFQIGFETSQMRTIKSSFDVAKKVRDLGYAAVRKSVAIGVEG